MHYMRRSSSLYINVRTQISGLSDPCSIFTDLPINANEIILDEFDAAPSTAINAFIKNITDGTDHRQYILAGRSRQAMGVTRLLALGVGRLIDASALAFTLAESISLADRHCLTYSAEELIQLLHETDGWPIAMHWIMRDASRDSKRLGGAFDLWRDTRGHLLSEFVATEYSRDADTFLKFTMFIRGGLKPGDSAIEAFEALGFPVLRTRTSLRAYRTLARLAHTDNEADVDSQSEDRKILKLKVLGRFNCEINGRPIKFIRRRDQDVFTFVALSANGRATRRELIEAFWSDLPRESSTQGLRTTLSRIRSAIGAVIGAKEVDRYFRSADDICLDAEHVSVDVSRFTECCARGEIAEGEGDKIAAKRFYLAADNLYSERILASEAVAPCFDAFIERTEAIYQRNLAHLAALDAAEQSWTQKLSGRVPIVKGTMAASRYLASI